MLKALRRSYMFASLFISVPIGVMNWVAPIIAILWLLFLKAWIVIIIGFVAGFISQIIFGLIVGLIPVVRKFFGEGAIASYFVARTLGVILFFILVYYSSQVFSFAEHVGLPVWPMAFWAYSTASSPWVAIASRLQHTDPMTIVWPTASQEGGLATMIAMLLGAPPALQGEILFCASLVGLITGWMFGTERVREIDRRVTSVQNFAANI